MTAPVVRNPSGGARRIALAALIITTNACGGARSTTNPDTSVATRAVPSTCAGVTAGSQVVVYSVIGLEYWYKDVLTTFQNDCRVSVAYIGLPADQILARLRSERNAPLADLVVLPVVEMAKADQEGLLGDGPAPADGVPDDRCGPQRRWCAVGESYASWVLRGAVAASPPKTFADLLDDRWRGRLQLSGPGQSDAGLAFTLLLNQVMGHEQADEYQTRLEANVAAHEANVDAMSRAVSAGTADLANGDLQEHQNDLLQFPGLDVWFPTIAAAEQPATVAIPVAAGAARNSRQPADGAVLLRSFWSPTAQTGLSAANLTPARLDVRPGDRRSQQEAQMLEGVHVVRVDWDAAVRELPATVQQWETWRVAPLVNTPTALPPPLAPVETTKGT